MSNFSVKSAANFGENAPTHILIQDRILLGRFSKILDSSFTGFGQIDDFSCVNRSKFGYGFGIGVSSYIADTSLGNFSLIGSRVSIGGFEHPLESLSVGAFQWGQSIQHWTSNSETIEALQKNSKPQYKNTVIGSDVWIGNNSVVKAGIKIGHGAIIGAGSVLTKDVGDFQVVVGNPARFLRMRFPEDIIRELLEIQWWLYPFETLSTLDFKDLKGSIIKLRELKRHL